MRRVTRRLRGWASSQVSSSFSSSPRTRSPLPTPSQLRGLPLLHPPSFSPALSTTTTSTTSRRGLASWCRALPVLPASSPASGRASGLTLAPASTQALVPSAAKKKTRAAARKRKKKGRTISSTSAASAAALQASAAAAAPSDTAAPASSSLLERECGLETPAFPEPSDSPPVELRPYQREAIDAVRDHLSRKGETRNPLVVLPPGAGKSLLVAEIIRSTMAANPSARVVVLAHTKELVEQNYDETMRYWPDCPAGVYQAALNKREGRAQVVFASIQSLYNNFDELVPPPSPDLILIDEAHLVPRRANKEDSRYGTFLKEAKDANAAVQVVGLTATPFRADTGLLTDTPEGAVPGLFGCMVYDYPISRAVAEGYLAPLHPKPAKEMIDYNNVEVRMGDYKSEKTEKLAEETTIAAVDEIIASGHDRKGWLIFCPGVSHAEKVAEEMKRRGVACESICGSTPKEQRVAMIQDFRDGKLTALTNCNVLTHGFNVPHVDLIAMLRPTLSPVLYVQMVGRGTRLAPGKKSCLVLDFAGNVMRHGPLDALNIASSGKAAATPDNSPAPVKICDECDVYNHAARRECLACGAAFPVVEPKEVEGLFQASPSDQPLLGKNEFRDFKIKYYRHSKNMMPDSLRVQYSCRTPSGDLQTFNEWVCLEHKNWAKRKARQWWYERTGSWNDIPKTVTEALDRSDSLEKPTSIAVKSGQYAQITPCFEEAEGAGQDDARILDGGVGEVRGEYDYATDVDEEGYYTRRAVQTHLRLERERAGMEFLPSSGKWHNKNKEKEDREAAAVVQAYNKLLSGKVTLLRPQMGEGSGGAAVAAGRAGSGTERGRFSDAPDSKGSGESKWSSGSGGSGRSGGNGGSGTGKFSKEEHGRYLSLLREHGQPKNIRSGMPNAAKIKFLEEFPDRHETSVVAHVNAFTQRISGDNSSWHSDTTRTRGKRDSIDTTDTASEESSSSSASVRQRRMAARGATTARRTTLSPRRPPPARPRTAASRKAAAAAVAAWVVPPTTKSV